ncbi:phage tail protein [Bradyrhizobium japonicum]|uniref:phage tail protein n=1 Tax=Bradyrhizobium japonicum TaxID=375 RepID=UPI001BAD1118|nr:phage tail protein [Bradyrhizobium japonicum]MBR0962260.1 phage tail protein [Bradyrhizobium japonicum]
MAIFTAIATATLAAVGITSTFAITALATGLSLAASVALSYAVKALSGKPQQSTDHFGVQGQIAGGGAVPRSFGLGRHVTAGSLVYANTWGNGYETPNAFLSLVIAVSDLAGEKLLGMEVNGSKVTLALGDALYSNFSPTSLGYQVPEYIKLHEGESSPTAHLFVKYYDGTQTAADGAMINASSIERPYTSAHVGKGMCYVVVHALIDENLWNGIPTFKFELSGIPLYDPSKDSTVGGSGAHRFSDPATWGGDGDDYPVVQAYAILRGISYQGTWLYGLQNTAAARLPVANWITQIGKCRSAVIGASGPEPSYRTGVQINVDAQPVNALETLMTGCQGKISEVGGFYKCHVGAPDSPSFSFTDGDILSTESQTFRPFFALADSVNGIQATYPDPSQGWNTATAPPYYRTDLEIRDGNRRLMASPAFDAVPYPEQVQRLQKSAVEEAQRARGHTIVLPPAFWLVEPGDVGEWTSARNGYVDKLFRVDGGTDKANLDVVLMLTEVDPFDYDWDTEADFKPVTPGGTVSNPPAPQGVALWDAQPYTLTDGTGLARRPAILIAWDGSQPGCNGLKYEVRLAADGSSVTRGTVNSFSAGNRIIHDGVLPATTYQVRGQYIPTTTRDMLWSDYVTVTTPDIRYSMAEFDAAIKAEMTTIRAAYQDQINEALNRFASVAADIAARAPLDKMELRSQLAARAGDALAQIDDVRTVAVTTAAAYASFSTMATATWGSTSAFVTQSAIAIATLEDYAAASWGVEVGVDGVITGMIRIDGGAGWSAVTIRADKFQLQLPGYNGDAPISPFTVGLIDGVSKIGMSGLLVHDGTFYGSRIVSGSVATLQLAVNGVGIEQLIDGAASNSDAASGTLSGVGGGTLASKTVTIKGGRAIVMGFLTSTVTDEASSRAIIGDLIVDGSTVKSGTTESAMKFHSLIDDSKIFARVPPLAIAAHVTGLSDGSHTFSFAASLGNCTGTLIVLNPRR